VRTKNKTTIEDGMQERKRGEKERKKEERKIKQGNKHMIGS
jgi:hypothetical protein